MTIDFDPFAPETGEEYSPEKFYTKAYDKRGHAVTARWGNGAKDTVKVPPYVAAAMENLRAHCPMLRNNQDVFRDAIIHYMKMRQEQYRDVLPDWWHSAVDQMAALAEVERIQSAVAQHEEIVSKIEDLLRASRGEEDLRQAVEVCERAAMTLEYGHYIRQASQIIDRYRR